VREAVLGVSTKKEKSMIIKISNRNDVYNYRLSDVNAKVCKSSNPEAITYDYFINLGAISTLKFYDNFDNQYALGTDSLANCRQSIVFGVGEDYEVLAFEESSGGEFQRIKREIEEAYNMTVSTDDKNKKGHPKGILRK